MKTIEELSAYLYALSLVNSNYGGDFCYCFRIFEIEKCETIVESIIKFEKTSIDYEGYSKYEYDLQRLQDGFKELKDRLSELFLDYNFWLIETCKLDSDIYHIEMMRKALFLRTKENLLSSDFVDSLVAIAGEDSQVFSVSVKSQENETSWSVLDFVWGQAFLIWGNNFAYLIEISGTD